MKNFLKVLLIFLVLLTAFVMFQVMRTPKVLEVSQTKVLDASPEAVYTQIIDFKNWDNWSVWNQMDPNMEKEYTGPVTGVGHKYAWDSEKKNVGSGSMEVTGAKLNEELNMFLDFGEQGTASSNMYLKPVDGGTEVTWDLKSNEEAKKMQNWFVGMMVNGTYKKGLAQLEQAAKENPNPTPAVVSRFSDVVKKKMPEQYFLGILAKTGTAGEEQAAAMSRDLPLVFQYASTNDIETLSAPAAMWLEWNPEENKAEYINGMMVPKGTLAPEGMVVKKIPAGSWYMVNHYGPYDNEEMAHNAIAAKAKADGKEIGMPISVYANDPTTVAPDEIKTEIWYPISN